MAIDIKIPGYELIAEIGSGGMAKVYLGMQVLLERKVAIKILHQRLSSESEEFKKRFFTEGKVLAKLQHENIVSIIDIGETDGMLYMVMEYVETGTLTDWLKKNELTVDQAIQICSKIGLALHSVHLKHIVHRDLKPSNILLRSINQPLLTDFGIARETDQEQGLTQTGHILGTLQYMSPEQIRGMHVDHRSDIYALGLMFYRLLVGHLPFQANSQYDLSRMQCEEIPPPLPPQLSDLQPIMDAMLAKDPADRFQSCLEFCKALQSLPVVDREYASELEGATRVFDPSMLSSGSFRTGRDSGQFSGRHSGQFSDRHSGQFSDRHSGQFSGRSDAVSGPYEATRMMTGQTGTGRPSLLKKGLIFGLPALMIVVAITLYFTLWYVPSAGLSDADQRRVDNYLRRVDANLLKLQIDSPPEDNAIYELRKALALAPTYEPALDRARQIAEFYETDARDLIDAKKLDEALDTIKKGLEVDPQYENLVQLEDDISTMLVAQKRQAEIAEALQVASDYQAKGQLVEPPDANAYTAYRKVLDLDPQNRIANQGLEAILTSLLDKAEKTLADGGLEQAGEQAQKIDTLFPNNRRVAEIKMKLAAKERDVREQAEVEEFLRVAQRQVEEGKLIEPESDNALESFTQALNRQPDNPVALNGLSQIASQFAAKANEAFDKGEYSAALTFANNGLLAAPDNAELLALQAKSTGQLSARDQEIQSLLQEAQRLVLSGSFLPPGDNALDTFNKVEELDPGNQQAARGLAKLPDQVYEEASQLEKLDDFSGAKALLEKAQKTFGEQQRFTELSTRLDDAIAEQAKLDQLQQMLDNSKKLIASQPMTMDTIDQAAKALGEINKAFPGNLTAAGQLDDFVQAIIARANQVSAGGNEESGFALLDRALGYYANNQQLLDSKDALEKARQARLAEEARRLAAMQGKLAIDAVPWGEVTEIRGADGKTQALPDNRSTPMLVTLMAGDYTVSIRDGNGGSPKQVTVNVPAQQTTVATAQFDSLSADDYFERSNW